MKRIISVILSTLIVFTMFTASPVTANAKNYKSGKYTYTVKKDKTAEIVKYKGKDGNIKLPSKLGGKKVTSIKSNAFYNNKYIKSVTVPDGVKSIGYCAFSKCSNLGTVKLPKGITHIGQSAFASTAFSNSKNNYYNGGLYIGTYYLETNQKEGTLKIKDKTTLIADGAAGWGYYMNDIDKIIIPNSVKYIGYRAFYDCCNAEIQSLPSKVKTIDDEAFCNCYKAFNKLVIPETCTKTGRRAFYACKNITSVEIKSKIKTVPAELFYACSGIKNVKLPSTVKKIEEYAFCCSALEKINLPSGITKIGYCALSATAAARNSAKKNGGIGYIGKYLVYCDENKSNAFKVKDGTVLIADNVAFECNITSVTLPKSLKYLGKNAFEYCKKIKSYNVKSGNKYFSSSNGILFNKKKTKLIMYPAAKDAVSYIIPKSVTSIGSYAFAYTNVKSISLQNKVKTVGTGAFEYCNNLSKVTIGKSVRTVKYMAFFECRKLKSVTVPKTVTKIEPMAFGAYHGPDEIDVLPDFVIKGYLYSAAENYCHCLTSDGKPAEYDITGYEDEIGSVPFIALDLKAPVMTASAKDGKLRIKYTKAEKASGYIIEYTTGNKTKRLTCKGSASAIKSIKNLKSGKYTVRIRSYKSHNKMTSYGNWSKIQTVNI